MNNKALLTALAFSLVLTLMLEAGFFLITGKRYHKDLLLLVLVNILTNPIVVILFWLAASYTEWHKAVILLPLELSAILTEGCYFQKYGRNFPRPYLFSCAVNIFSFLGGILLQKFIN